MMNLKAKLLSTFCVWVGHSRIVTTCFGYVSCARCEEQIGDTLMGAFSAKECVIVDHDCKTCRQVAATLTWRDRIFAPNPGIGRGEPAGQDR